MKTIKKYLILVIILVVPSLTAWFFNNSIRDSYAQLEWETSFPIGTAPESRPFIEDFNGDSVNEVGMVIGGKLTFFNGITKSVEWKYDDVRCEDFDFGDLEGDGPKEIVIASDINLLIIDPSTHGVKRNYESTELKSNIENSIDGVRLFDRNVDGKSEILYHNKTKIWVINGETFDTIWTLNLQDASESDYFIISYLEVADLDHNGDFEIIALGSTREGADYLRMYSESSRQLLWEVEIPFCECFFLCDLESDNSTEIFLANTQIIDTETHAFRQEGPPRTSGNIGTFVGDIDNDGVSEIISNTPKKANSITVWSGKTFIEKWRFEPDSEDKLDFKEIVISGNIDNDDNVETVVLFQETLFVIDVNQSSPLNNETIALLSYHLPSIIASVVLSILIIAMIITVILALYRRASETHDSAET
jgi:hypothetical protein